MKGTRLAALRHRSAKPRIVLDVDLSPERAKGPASIILQQPLDVVEFELRALGVAEAAAQFFQDAAHPLHVDLAGNLYREIVAEFAAVQRPAQGIAVAA